MTNFKNSLGNKSRISEAKSLSEPNLYRKPMMSNPRIDQRLHVQVIKKDLPLTFKPSKREMARKGRSALNVLNERKAAKSERTVRLRIDI